MIIGITGNSGSGKSYVTSKLQKEFMQEKVLLIDADKIAKDLATPKNEYYNKIVLKFGKEILLSNGNIDRKILAKIVFNDKEKRTELDKLTFEFVVKEIKNLIEVNKEKVIILDAPLLIESKLDKLCDFTIGVLADEKIKLDRICKRDEISIELAKERINAQSKDEFYIKNCNYIVRNNIDSKIEEQIKKILGEENV